jgi:hypothetical protein
MAAKKQYYFVRYVKSGRTYYKNQDGKRVARAKVKKDRKKVYIELGRTIGNTFLKGDLVSLRDYKSKLKALKARKWPEVSTFNIINVNLQKDIANSISESKNIYIQRNGNIYFLRSQQSQAALHLFVNQINSHFYNTVAKVTDSPLFNIQIQDSPKNIFYDFDSIKLNNPQLLNDQNIRAAYEEFTFLVEESFTTLFST